MSNFKRKVKIIEDAREPNSKSKQKRQVAGLDVGKTRTQNNLNFTIINRFIQSVL